MSACFSYVTAYNQGIYGQLGWKPGGTVITTGKRPLSGLERTLGGGYLDETNREVLHEDVIWVDGNGRIHALGYSPDGLFNSLEKGFTIDQYTLSSERWYAPGDFKVAKLLSSVPWRSVDMTPPIIRNMPFAPRSMMSWSWAGRGYNLVQHNCQNYCDAARSVLNQTFGQ